MENNRKIGNFYLFLFFYFSIDKEPSITHTDQISGKLDKNYQIIDVNNSNKGKNGEK